MEKYEKYDSEWKTNRQKVKEYKTGYYWCGGCDCNLVNDGCKCEVCGRRNGVRRNKKQ